MNLFEAIFVRKSVRSYTNEGISPKVLEDILKQFDEINGLFGGVETGNWRFLTIDRMIIRCSVFLESRHHIIWCCIQEEKDRAMMNAGYLMEQLSLYMYTRWNRKLFYRQPIIKKKYQYRDKKRMMVVMAFGSQREAVIGNRRKRRG